MGSVEGEAGHRAEMTAPATSALTVAGDDILSRGGRRWTR